MTKRAAFLSWLLILSALDARLSSAGCDRRFSPPPEDDCSSVEVPCFVWEEGGSGGGLLPVQLEYPDNNTRTCYRTCIDDDDPLEPVCEATLTGVHNQALNKDPDLPEFSLQRMFSPNYNDGKNYRKSTICRYNVKCEGDKLLSYNFVTHILECRSNHCGNSCVDHVEIDLPHLGGEKMITCGLEAEMGVMYSDGTTEIDVEFMANREEQAHGFMIFAWCSDPAFDINAQWELYLNSSRRKRDSEDRHFECAEPAGTERPTVDAVEQLSAAIPESEESLHSPSARRIILNEGDTLVYINRRVEITRGTSLLSAAEPGTVEDVYEIEKLYVSNRIEESRAFRRSAKEYFQGYGELWISGHNAYLLQLGVNPIFKPTEEEMKIILELETELEKTLRSTDFFDVYDLEDEKDPEEERGEEVSNETAATLKRDPSLDRMAMEYGTACNGLLRSVACAYQQVILKRNCITGEEIDRPSTSASETTFNAAI